MTQAKFTQADLDAVSDNPELTEDDFIRAKPFAEVFPALAAKLEAVHLREHPKVDVPK